MSSSSAAQAAASASSYRVGEAEKKMPESPSVVYASENNREFYRVGGADLSRLGVLTDIFNRILTPLYGSQDKAIAQIKDSKDRAAFLLYENSHPMGVLVFKTELSQEYKDLGVSNSIEIKSLFIDHSVENSGRGLGSALIDKLFSEVKKLNLNASGVHVTVSEKKQESLTFFKKKGFEIKDGWKDRYEAGTVEYLLFCPAKLMDTGQALVRAQDAASGLAKDEPELSHIIHNAHSDDIHFLKLLPNGSFLSGSKDNTISMWDPKGNLVQIVRDVEPALRREEDWITSIDLINREYFAVGNRSGTVSLWKTDGEYIKELKMRLPKWDHVALPENRRRVNCIAAGLSKDKPSLFVGFPTMFNEFNLIEGRTESTTVVHKNDWVYAIEPLTDSRVLIAVGGTLQAWSKNGGGWGLADVIVQEGKRVHGQAGQKPQRAFISSVAPLSHGSEYGLALFDGSIQICDVNKKAITQKWSEHKGRVWQCLPFTKQLITSCGDDAKVLFYDVRQANSVHKLEKHAGPVTTIMKLSEHILVAGSCPADKKNGAEMKWYDLRKMGALAKSFKFEEHKE